MASSIKATKSQEKTHEGGQGCLWKWFIRLTLLLVIIATGSYLDSIRVRSSTATAANLVQLTIS